MSEIDIQIAPALKMAERSRRTTVRRRGKGRSSLRLGPAKVEVAAGQAAGSGDPAGAGAGIAQARERAQAGEHARTGQGPAGATGNLGLAISEEALRGIVEHALHHEGAEGGVTLVLTDDEGIRSLNRDFRGVDAPTDVLAFGAQEEAAGFVAAPGMEGYLGDVIVSYPRAVAQAAEQGHSVAEELALLIVHGVLHLLGYDHGTEAEKATMWARQEAILQTSQKTAPPSAPGTAPASAQ